MGFVKGKLPGDEEILGSLSLGKEKTFIMMGTVDEEIIKDPTEHDYPEVLFIYLLELD